MLFQGGDEGVEELYERIFRKNTQKKSLLQKDKHIVCEFLPGMGTGQSPAQEKDSAADTVNRGICSRTCRTYYVGGSPE